jgi:salicylate hydroxylase
MNSDTPILIVGGGLGGAALALGLARRGLPVRLFEQAETLGEIGAGLTVSGGAMRALHWLGVADAVRARSERAARLPLLHYRTGALIAGAYDESGGDDPPDWTTRHMHRADLHDILVSALGALAPDALATGHRFARAQSGPDSVTAHFENGGSAEGSLLIGCDGLRSAVRAQMFGAEQPRFTGQVTWRCLIPIADAKPFMQAGRSAIFMGPARLFNRYTVRGGQVVNCVATARADVWRDEGWTTPSTVALFREHYEGWHPDILGLIEAAPPDRLFKWAMFERDPLPAWTDGRMGLLGDAAHPMLPFLGLGAALAMEDAVVLTRAILAYGANPEALKRYEASRIGRATLLFHEARRQGALFQSADPDSYAQAKPPAQDRSFYEYDPGAAEI